MIAALLALVVAAELPPYLRKIAWRCEASVESTLNGMAFDHLTRCRAQGKPTLRALVQSVADAMGNAGHPPRLRVSGGAPYLYAQDGERTVSATFVSGPSGVDVWVALTRPPGGESPRPLLPVGATLLTDHVEASGKRMLSLRLAESVRDAQALVHATLDTLQARALSSTPIAGGIGGRLAWGDKAGFYEVIEHGPHESFLTLYVGSAR